MMPNFLFLVAVNWEKCTDTAYIIASMNKQEKYDFMMWYWEW